MSLKRKSIKVLFYSPQGGTGKSTLAVNSAIFSALFGNKTLLIDMADYGCVNSILKIPQKGVQGLSSILTIMDLSGSEVSSPGFQEIFMSSINTCNISEKLGLLLSGSPMKMESINENHIKIIFEQLKQLDYDIVFIDTSSELCVRNVVLLEEADIVIVPVIQDISCGWKLVAFKEIVEKCNIDLNKIKLCVNRCSKYNYFNNQELESEVGFKILCEIPDFIRKFQCYVNEGKTIHMMKNKKVYQSFYSATKAILNELGAVSTGK